MNEMFERANFPEAHIIEQSRAVMEYFQLPSGLAPDPLGS